MTTGISTGEGNTLIVGFEGFKDFYAHYAAGGLNCKAITLALSETSNQEITAAILCRLMEKDTFGKRLRRKSGSISMVKGVSVFRPSLDYTIHRGEERTRRHPGKGGLRNSDPSPFDARKENFRWL